MQNNKKFSIILPVLNEENNIKQLIFLITKNLKNFNYEIIFIDDNSSDNTGKNIKTHVSRTIKYFFEKKK